MSLKTTIQHLLEWLHREFDIVEKKLAPAAVSILQHVKQDIENGSLDFLANVLGFVTHSNLPKEFVSIIQNKLPHYLAGALAIQGIPINPTDEELKAFAQNVITAFGLPVTNRARILTVVGTDLLQELKAFAASDQQETWAVDAAELEKCFQILAKDIQAVNG